MAGESEYEEFRSLCVRHTVTIKGLEEHHGIEEVFENMSKYGIVLGVEMPKQANGGSYDLAFVHYKFWEDARSALVEDNSYWPGSDDPIRVFIEGYYEVKPDVYTDSEDENEESDRYEDEERPRDSSEDEYY